MFIAMNRFRIARAVRPNSSRSGASATVTSPASPAFDISICCKGPAIHKRRSHLPFHLGQRCDIRGLDALLSLSRRPR